MTLPAPWNVVEKTIAATQDYSVGAQRLADFFKGTEERVDPDQLIFILQQSKPSSKWMERFFFSLLDVGVSDRQVGMRALGLRRLKRLVMRIETGVSVQKNELELADKLREGIQLGDWNDFYTVAIEAREHFSTLMAGQTLEHTLRQKLALLVRCEALALQERVNWLSENVDPYNMKTMARVLPRLRIYDEEVHEGRVLADRLDNGEQIGVCMLSFEYQMKTSAYEKWFKKIGKTGELQRLQNVLTLQREKKLPTLDLVALASVCRWVREAKDDKSIPLDWLEMALQSYHEGDFSVEAGESAKALGPAMASAGAKVFGSRITGNFHVKSYPDWVGRDLLTRSFQKVMDDGLLDPKALVTQNMLRDSVLEALLNNPKINQAPGLVGFVATMCRSLSVLSKIAKDRQLHSGFANRDVPLALISNPCNIPMSLLHGFINTRYVSMLDLRRIEKTKTGIRREVREEITHFLKTL